MSLPMPDIKGLKKTAGEDAGISRWDEVSAKHWPKLTSEQTRERLEHLNASVPLQG
jgi:hypothetical protein